jgi:hypothetical protein
MGTIHLRYRYLCGGALLAIGFGLVAGQPVTAAPLGLGASATPAAAEDSSLVTEVAARGGGRVGRAGVGRVGIGRVGVGRVGWRAAGAGAVALGATAAAPFYGSGYAGAGYDAYAAAPARSSNYPVAPIGRRFIVNQSTGRWCRVETGGNVWCWTP